MTRQDIVNEVHKHIPFFRKNWQKFCQWVEECAGELHRYQSEQTDEYYKLMDIEPRDAKLRRRTSAARRKMEKQQKALRDKSWVSWCRSPGGLKGQYGYAGLLDGKGNYIVLLDLPMRGTFYAPSDVVNPILWIFDQPNPRPTRDDEAVLCNCAVLTVLHDSETTDGELCIYRRDLYEKRIAPEGKYFTHRDKFCMDLRGQLRAKDESGELQRAWCDVRPHAIADPAETKPDTTRAKCWSIVKKITGWLFKKTSRLIGAIIVAIIGGLIVAVLIDIFGDFGWIERIKAFIYEIIQLN